MPQPQQTSYLIWDINCSGRASSKVEIWRATRIPALRTELATGKAAEGAENLPCYNTASPLQWVISKQHSLSEHNVCLASVLRTFRYQLSVDGKVQNTSLSGLDSQISFYPHSLVSPLGCAQLCTCLVSSSPHRVLLPQLIARYNHFQGEITLHNHKLVVSSWFRGQNPIQSLLGPRI